MQLDLGGQWQVRQTERAGADWLDAAVPGCIHLDLMRAGQIADPFYGDNDAAAKWIDEAAWTYRRTFDCPAALAGKKRVELVCDGLNTFATVLLNDEELGRADNMFVQWRWDVTGKVRAGENELVIVFESPVLAGRALMDEHGPMEQRIFEAPQRVYTRKAQYESGWDWGPDLNTSGIWKPIRLEACDAGRITDVCARVDWTDADRPVVRALVEIEAIEACTATLTAELTGPGETVTVAASSDLPATTTVLELHLPVADPQLWWPLGKGPQDLYSLAVSGTIGDEEVAAAPVTVGLRRVELVREEDDEGESFVIHVNGEPVFCKGANWIPSDSFLPRMTDADYGELVQMAADAGMNMLRIWGGGVYEHDAFFEACDRLGILVWHDFMFACAPYPDNLDWFCDSVRLEAEQNVRRLRNHPSLVLWCGSNENHVFYGARGEDFPGKKLYEEILPEVCGRLDPDCPYWPGSPYGGPNHGCATHGDQHYWDVWHGQKHPSAYAEYDGRFVSEFGVQAPPTMETIRRYIPAGEHDMLSRMMEHHNCATDGPFRVLRYLGSFFRIPASFADAVYLAQLAQGESIKLAVEHWRSRMFRSAGAVFWQFNDCWPVTSWSCIDYEKRPKALYHYSRRFFAPVLPVLKCEDGRPIITIANDRREHFNGELICGFGSLDGDQQWVIRQDVSAAANSATAVDLQGAGEVDEAAGQDHYLWCRLLEDDAEIARNSVFVLPFKHVQLKVPEWEVSVEKTGGGEFVVHLGSDTFAKGARLRLEGLHAEFSDNCFDVFPEVPISVRVRTRADVGPDDVRRRLRVRSVAEVRHRRM